MIVIAWCNGKENQKIALQTTQLRHFCNILRGLFYIPEHSICIFLAIGLFFSTVIFSVVNLISFRVDFKSAAFTQPKGTFTSVSRENRSEFHFIAER